MDLNSSREYSNRQEGPISMESVGELFPNLRFFVIKTVVDRYGH